MDLVSVRLPFVVDDIGNEVCTEYVKFVGLRKHLHQRKATFNCPFVLHLRQNIHLVLNLVSFLIYKQSVFILFVFLFFYLGEARVILKPGPEEGLVVGHQDSLDIMVVIWPLDKV